MLKIAFLFPGQGSQKIGMGEEFYLNFNSSKKLLDDAKKELDIDFNELLFRPNEKLSQSEFTQPAIVLNSLMSYKALMEELEFDPLFCIGHSLGEFSALCVSGAFSYIDALKIVNLRGKFMQEECDGKDYGMMVVLGLDDLAIKEIIKEREFVYAANFNCDGQIVLAGKKSNLDLLLPLLKEAGAKKAMMLDMSVISHCPLLKDAALKLYDALLKFQIAQSFNPVISNVTAKPYDNKKEALELLKRQLTSPVLYAKSIEDNEDRVDAFVEFGSGVLKGINRRVTKKPTFSIVDLKSLEQTVSELKKL